MLMKGVVTSVRTITCVSLQDGNQAICWLVCYQYTQTCSVGHTGMFSALPFVGGINRSCSAVTWWRYPQCTRKLKA